MRLMSSRVGASDSRLVDAQVERGDRAPTIERELHGHAAALDRAWR